MGNESGKEEMKLGSRGKGPLGKTRVTGSKGESLGS